MKVTPLPTIAPQLSELLTGFAIAAEIGHRQSDSPNAPRNRLLSLYYEAIENVTLESEVL
jgi:hypothetical protein